MRMHDMSMKRPQVEISTKTAKKTTITPTSQQQLILFYYRIHHMIMARLQRTADNNIRAASAARATASATMNAAATGLVDLTTMEDTNVM